MSYRSLGRLTPARTSNRGLQWTHDDFGNRLAQSATAGTPPTWSLTYDVTSNRITAGGYSYDNNGDLTTFPAPAGKTTVPNEDSGKIRAIAPPSGANPSFPGFTTEPGGLIYFYSGFAFFTGQVNGQPLGGWASGMSLQDIQQVMVIHEFMHFMNIVGADDDGQQYVLPNGDKVSGSQGISQEIRKKCFNY
jgi:hypothetical protein